MEEKHYNSPKCTICIANYNGESVIETCIESVLGQDCDYPIEIIVHDDLSTDSSVSIIETKYPQIKLIKSAENVGFCISNNRMVEQARGEYVLLLNNDAALQPDALKTLMDNAQLQKSQGILTLPQYDWQTGELVDRGCLLDPFYNPIPNLCHKRRDVAMVIGACLWIPRWLWHELGGFPDWIESIGEDLFLCCVCRLYGYPVQVTPTSGYHHWQGLNFSGRRTFNRRLVSSYRRRYLSERNKTLVMMATYPSEMLPIILPLHMAVILFEGIIITMVTMNWELLRQVYLRLPISLWMFRKHIWKERKWIQGGRRIGYSVFLSPFRWVPWKLRMLIHFGMPQVR
ncbi:MAG: glycosyl transferase [Gammaproteobacteria bacterium]|nr:MAG: glycosyl transferase [Gammaproteobacteria bacterium]